METSNTVATLSAALQHSIKRITITSGAYFRPAAYHHAGDFCVCGDKLLADCEDVFVCDALEIPRAPTACCSVECLAYELIYNNDPAQDDSLETWQAVCAAIEADFMSCQRIDMGLLRSSMVDKSRLAFVPTNVHAARTVRPEAA